MTLALPVASRASVSVLNSGEVESAQITVEQPSNLRGWTLVSVKGGQKLQLPGVDLAAGRSIRVISGSTAAAPSDIRWTGRNVWNNTGDTALLLDGTGALVAEHTYGATSARGSSPVKAASAKGTRKRR